MIIKNKCIIKEQKTSLHLLCDDYVLSIADGTSITTFLGTRKLEPEEVYKCKPDCSLNTQISDELSEVKLL